METLKEVKILFMMLFISAALLAGLINVYASDPGHVADSIDPGTFGPGNYTINGNFSVGAGGKLNFFIDNSTGNVGIGTSKPTTALYVNGVANFTTATASTSIIIGSKTGTYGNTLTSYAGSSFFGIPDQSDFEFTTAAGALLVSFNASGKVGIGTSSPGKTLDVRGSGGVVLNGTSGGLAVDLASTHSQGTYFELVADNGTFADIGSKSILSGSGTDLSLFFLAQNGRSIYFGTDGSATVKASIDLPGNFTVKGNLIVQGNSIATSAGADLNYIAVDHNFYNAGTLLVQIDSLGDFGAKRLLAATGNSLCYSVSGSLNFLSTCSSSIRYKENIEPLTVNKADVFALQPVNFKWKGRNETGVGLIAEEVNKTLPAIVTYNSNGTIEGVEYKLLSIYLLSILKDQDAEIQNIKGQISALQMENKCGY